MAPRSVHEWGEIGDRLLETLDHRDLQELAVTAARIRTLAIMRAASARSQPPTLLDAKGAARLLGLSPKCLYNHAKDLPPGCVRRIGRRLLFVGHKLQEWACDTSRQTRNRHKDTAA